MKVENLLVFIRIYAKFDVPKKKKREGAKALPYELNFIEQNIEENRVRFSAATSHFAFRTPHFMHPLLFQGCSITILIPK